MTFGLPLGALVAIAFAVIFILNWIKVLNEYERGVIFRFGKLLPSPRGPGLVLVFAPIDRLVRISLRLVAFDVPPQDIITRDNVSVKVNAVVFFRVVDPTKAVIEVEDYLYATSQARADHAPQRPRAGGPRRPALAARLAERPVAGHPRQEHRSLGDQGGLRRGQARGPAGRNDPGARAPGRGGAREARQGHPRRGRVPGLRPACPRRRSRGHATRSAPSFATCRR